MVTILSHNITKKFNCDICHYKCDSSSDWKKHIATTKHINSYKQLHNSYEEVSVKKYTCVCGKEYNHRQNLYTHKQKCSYTKNQIQKDNQPDNSTNNQPDNSTNNQPDNSTLTNIIFELMKQNNEFKDLIKEQNNEFKDLIKEQNKQMIELAKQVGNNPNITNNTNSHNTNTNKFSINLFLNEKCKDALNITDFVEQLNVTVKDLEETGRLGFSEGISKIFINGLKQLEFYKRPLHCNDEKRETLYIKNQDKWVKETEEKTVLTKALKEVACKNIKQISNWQKIHKNYSDPNSKENDKYLKIVSESMSGTTKEECNKNYDKIIKNVVKETVIPSHEK